MNKDELFKVIRCYDNNKMNNYKLMTAVLWIKCLLQGKSPIDRLRENAIEKIIVYGITELGEMLIQESIKEGYRIAGITDKKIVYGDYRFQNIPLLTIDELSDYKDEHIVVTAVTFWDEIKKELNTHGHSNVIALWELM